ncbi:bis(5'-nucleosyl)-tetraphosphatase (symmetrical) YqeK [Cohnella fermenti]|uniref:bis(5'-nucleosyl)-tetraphosphatase (symmetrical) n=1 Tax=Cohnella fermenti TaxID=2565925 RepID=A0A4S4BQZ0_9BACL|nr:bis(5'-nucleosyl)-tetraphosphatase (symmetrical) YqeK [Cohnella fermenti]THF75033.1 HD domain-containing protein [Cohnella fermenti]
MNREELIEATRRQMPEKRWRHVQGVVDTAVELADRFGGNRDQAWLAALLHDYTKAWATDRMERILREEELPKELLEHDKELWHAHVGAWVVRREHGIDDEEVLDAIRYHTSGRERMTLLDKIVCLADYIEPSRSFPGVDRLRELAKTNLDDALLAGFDGTIRALVEQGKVIFPLTVLARNDLLLTIRSSAKGNNK